MRVGDNPAKAYGALAATARHRTILPVYIPERGGYYAQALDVLALCLDSLAATCASPVTVIANGCHRDVVAMLEARALDQLVINAHNRGKVDAIVGAARGSHEPLITLADADVLFQPGWVEATHAIFAAFPEAGVVAPSPNPQLVRYHTVSTLVGGARELAQRRVVPDEDLDRFARSIGRPEMFTARDRAQQTVIARGDRVACVGCGHFVLTLRREAIAALPLGTTQAALGGSPLERALDAPPDRAGFWRLATPRAYAHHIGNTVDGWMQVPASAPSEMPAGLPASAPSRVPWRVRALAARAVGRALGR